MALPSGLAVVYAPAVDDDSHVVGIELTQKQARFAAAWAETGNKAAAYRIAYNVQERTHPNTIWVNASRIASLPHVYARFKVLNEEAALDTIMSVRELFKWAVDVATADPTEIVKVLKRNCRYCHGAEFGHQWINENEFFEALETALAAEISKLPTDEGGYGYNRALEPNPLCPHCLGVGIGDTVITDTTKLTGKAKKLYAGAKQDRFGCIEVKLHDQKAYYEMACRMAGAFDDRLDLRTPEERAKAEAATKMPDDITAENAAKKYLELVK